MKPGLLSQSQKGTFWFAPAASVQTMCTAMFNFTCLCSRWTTAESIKYHQSQTVCVSKSTVTCNNTDIPDSYLNHKHALSVMSCKFCLPEVCTHPAHTCWRRLWMWRGNVFMWKVWRKRDTETKRGRHRKSSKSLPRSYPNTEDKSLSYPGTTTLLFPSSLCVSRTHCKFWMWTFPNSFIIHSGRNTFTTILNERKKLCCVV